MGEYRDFGAEHTLLLITTSVLFSLSDIETVFRSKTDEFGSSEFCVSVTGKWKDKLPQETFPSLDPIGRFWRL